MADFPLQNWHDMNADTFNELQNKIVANIDDKQNFTLTTACTIGGQEYTTVEDTLHAIEAVLNS